MTTAEHIDATYSAGPIDWTTITDRAKDLYLYDRFNVMSLSVDEVMVLLGCRRELIQRDTTEATPTERGESGATT